MFEHDRLEVEDVWPVGHVHFLESVTASDQAAVVAHLETQASLLVPIKRLVDSIALEFRQLTLSVKHGLAFLFKGVLGWELAHISEVDEADFAHFVGQEDPSHVIEACSLHVCHFFVRTATI